MQQLKSGTVGKGQGYFSLIMETSKESIEDCAPDLTCLHPEMTGEISTHVSLAKASHTVMPKFKEVVSRKGRS